MRLDNVGGNDDFLGNLGNAILPYASEKNVILTGTPILTAVPKPGAKPTPSVVGGTYWIGGVSAGTMAGVGGAETCTGVILVPVNPNANQSTVIYHFQGTDKVGATLAKLNLTGYKAYLCGAAQDTKNTDAATLAANSAARNTLSEVISNLKSKGVPIVGYYEVGDLAVGSDGTIYKTTPAGTPTTQYVVPRPPAQRPARIPNYIMIGPFIMVFDPEDGA